MSDGGTVSEQVLSGGCLLVRASIPSRDTQACDVWLSPGGNPTIGVSGRARGHLRLTRLPDRAPNRALFDVLDASGRSIAEVFLTCSPSGLPNDCTQFGLGLYSINNAWSTDGTLLRTGTRSLDAGVPYDVEIAWNGTARTMELWVNGSLYASVDAPGAVTSSRLAQIRVGLCDVANSSLIQDGGMVVELWNWQVGGSDAGALVPP